MSETIDSFSQKDEGTPSAESLDSSLGHGMVLGKDYMARYVVVESDHPLISKESPVGRIDYGTLAVSGSLPTKPEGQKPDLPTQSEAVRSYISQEREAKGLEPLDERPEARYLKPKEVRESLDPDLGKAA